MNKLQMVDVGKLNEVLNYLKKDNDNKKVLTGITNPSQLNLEEKLDALDNKARSQEHASEKIAQFIKTKNTYKRKNPETTSHARKGEEGEEEEEEEEKEEVKKKETSQLISENNLLSFLKRKQIKTRKDNVILNGKKINEADLIHDLSHNAVKPTSYNLPGNIHNVALEELRKKNMPAKYIRNVALRSKYMNLKRSGSSSTSTSSSTSGSDNVEFESPSKWRKIYRR